MEETIQFQLNGAPARVTVDSDRLLLWVLRTDLNLTGTKYGCGEGHCGSCTVLVDGEAVRSCRTQVKAVRGRSVVTIEGLAQKGRLHPLQEAFMEQDAVQCGYCTPGMIMTAHAFLKTHPRPSKADIISGMENNLCRCGAHNRIIAAIQRAAVNMKGGA